SGGGAGVAGAARGDPLAQQAILPGAGGEASSAFVGDGAGRLEQEQTAVRVVGIGAAAEAVARERTIIEGGIVAEQAEPETALALERSVTGTGVATRPPQERHDMPLEVDLAEVVPVRQAHRLGAPPGSEQQQGGGEQQGPSHGAALHSMKDPPPGPLPEAERGSRT